MITLLSNNSCSKSNSALEYIRSFTELRVHVRQYMDDPLDKKELQELLRSSKRPALELVRATDKAFMDHFGGKDLSDEELIDILVQRPELMQRPILVDGDTVIIGRPPELILEYLRSKRADISAN